MTDATDWYGPESATFGDRLAAARDAAGMDAETLARRLGVRLKTLQDWENGISEPRANRLQMLSGLLDVPMAWLITGEGEGLPSPEAHEGTPPADIAETLLELRALRGDIRMAGDRLARLEKRLRQLLRERADT